MSELVIDASVAIKWFLEEEHSDEARVLLHDRNHTLIAPDLLYAEVGNVLWKRMQRSEISAMEASELAAQLIALPLECVAAALFLQSAVELACGAGRTVYDCLYIALAIHRDAILITAEERLANAVRATPLAPFVRWLGDRAADG